MRKDFGNMSIVRKLGERIVIGDPMNPMAFVSVNKIGSNRVSLVVSCHRDVPINRDEVANEIIKNGRTKVL